jgi:multisubunit Na+/H+ antiporter MnhB subunit
VEPVTLTLIDGLLAAILLVLAWTALESERPDRGVVLFIAFGLVLALVWARLRAPDVALAEAAIGAGLSGALLLAALRDQGSATVAGKQVEAKGIRRRLPGIAIAVLSLGLAGTLAWAFVSGLNTADPSRLAGKVLERLGESGVSNPVTAVLLNVRAYDTLLELAVLLVALLGILALAPERPGYRTAGPVFSGLAHWLLPMLVLTSGYLLWVGAHAPGGAFQAGAVLAAAGVVLRLAGHPAGGLPRGTPLRLLLILGAGVFLLVGAAPMLGGLPFLAYPAGWAGGLILLIESAATLAIAVTLARAFAGGRPREE